MHAIPIPTEQSMGIACCDKSSDSVIGQRLVKNGEDLLLVFQIQYCTVLRKWEDERLFDDLKRKVTKLVCVRNWKRRELEGFTVNIMEIQGGIDSFNPLVISLRLNSKFNNQFPCNASTSHSMHWWATRSCLISVDTQ